MKSTHNRRERPVYGLHRLSENNGNMLENVALIYAELHVKDNPKDNNVIVQE